MSEQSRQLKSYYKNKHRKKRYSFELDIERDAQLIADIAKMKGEASMRDVVEVLVMLAKKVNGEKEQICIHCD